MQQPQALAPATHAHMSPQEATAEQTLRAHLLPHIGSPQTNSPAGAASSPGHAGSASPREVNPNIDPAISGVGAPQQQQGQQGQQQQSLQPAQSPSQPQAQASQMHQQPAQQMMVPQQGMQMMPQQVMPQGVSMDQQHQGSQSQSGAEESEQPKRGGKRELSTSKRAAQNRAAQRAFRQRKEGYIKKLEEQVRDLGAMQESYKQIQNENYQLRDYIINLQSRLIESQGEDAVPPPPAVLVHPAPPLMVVDATISGAPVAPSQGGQQTMAAPQTHSHAVPMQQQPGAVGAPTANMGVQQQAPQSVTQVQVPQQVDVNAGSGQKRSHEDADQAFLQSIAQAAGTTSNGFMSTSAPGMQTRKSTSPNAKRVKAEAAHKAAEATKQGEAMSGV